MQTMNKFRIAKTIAYFIVGFTPFNAVALNESDVNGKVDLSYKVNILGSNLGEIHTTITKNNQNFEISSITRAEGVASLILGGNVTQGCSFSTTDQHIISSTSNIEKKGRKAFKNDIQIDWDSRFINYNNESSLSVPSGYLIDFCNFHFAAAYTDHEFLKKHKMYVLDGKKSRLKSYIFKSISQEKIKIPAGEFEANKITFERELNPDKSITFWTSEKYPYFPLKMVETRKSKKRILTLKSISTKS